MVVKQKLSIKAFFVFFILNSFMSVGASDKEPSVRHGAEQVVGGLLFELPKTIFKATMSGPPVAGTVIGVLAGAVGALQKTVSGVMEMAVAFDFPE